MKRTLLTMAAFAMLTSGCATITRGTTQHISVDSDPQGALVRAESGQTLITPGTFELKRNAPHYLTCSMEGYEESKQVITPSVSGGGAAGMAGNLIVGGIIGAAVDAGSGAMYDLSPSTVYFRLEEKK